MARHLLSGTWSYQNQVDWGESYPTCNGDHNSPVDIVESAVELNSDLKNLKMEGYDVAEGDMHLAESSIDTWENNHLRVDMTTTNQFISGADLGQSYFLAQFHFHWGDSDSVGSEHTRNGMHYIAEGHLVHVRTDFADISMAAQSNEPDALAVVGFFFEYGEASTVLAKLLADVPSQLPENDTAVNIRHEVLDLLNLLELEKGEVSNYYTYNGGLTTPSCNEIVKWTVMQDPVSMSHDQMNFLRNLKSSDGASLDYLGNTYRFTQDLAGRTVYATADAMEEMQGSTFADNFLPSVIVLAVVASIIAVGSFLVFPSRIRAATLERIRLKDEEEAKHLAYKQAEEERKRKHA